MASETDRLRELADDWDQYSRLGDEQWRKQMQRTVWIEMEIELKKLRRYCGMSAPQREAR